jgi:hypothetical protein
MKPTTPSRPSLGNIFKNDHEEQPIRVIKAAQAAKLFNTAANGQAGHSAHEPHGKAEIRMLGAGADYVDLELVCGCGETTRFRCWNTPATAAAAA